MRRLRTPDDLLLVSALALIALLYLDWFSAPPGASTTGWSALGWFVVALVAGCAVAAFVVVLMLAVGVQDSVNLRVGVPLAAVTPPAFIVLLVCVLVEPDATIRWPAWTALGVFAALTVAAWWSLQADGPQPVDRGAAPPQLRPAP